MSVPTAHKILIATAIVFFIFFALREFSDYTHGADPQALVWSIASAAVAAGLLAYLRRYVRSLGRP